MSESRFWVAYVWLPGYKGEPYDDHFDTLQEAKDFAIELVSKPVSRVSARSRKRYADGVVIERMGDQEALAFAAWREDERVRTTSSPSEILALERRLDKR